MSDLKGGAIGEFEQNLGTILYCESVTPPWSYCRTTPAEGVQIRTTDVAVNKTLKLSIIISRIDASGSVRC